MEDDYIHRYDYQMQKGGRPMNTELKNAVKATDQEAQYDASAKRLLGQKVYW